MPRAYPEEFRNEVIQAALNRPQGVTLTQVAAGFGVAVPTLETWLHRYRVDTGIQPGVTSSEKEEIARLKREKKQLEYEVEILRRAAAFLSQANLPGKGTTRW